MAPKEKLYHAQVQGLSIKCAYRWRGCILIEALTYLFPTENERHPRQ